VGSSSVIRKLCECDVVEILLDLAHLQQEQVFVAVVRNHVVVNFRCNSEMVKVKNVRRVIDLGWIQEEAAD
jgi:hypothetical protein